MKKNISMILAVAMLIGMLAGCSGSKMCIRDSCKADSSVLSDWERRYQQHSS